jgi:hypothetical protein
MMRDVGKRKGALPNKRQTATRTLRTVLAAIPMFIEVKSKERAWVLASALVLSCITWAVV